VGPADTWLRTQRAELELWAKVGDGVNCRHPARLSYQACGRAAHVAASKTFTLFLLAVFRHAGPIRVDLDICPRCVRCTSEP
jgi:hypothetical protein